MVTRHISAVILADVLQPKAALGITMLVPATWDSDVTALEFAILSLVAKVAQ